MTDKKLKVLFICTGNSCRSQMAEGFLREIGGGMVRAYSAGLEPAGLNSRAVAVMAEAGIDISNHSSDHVKNYVGRQFDYVITVCDHAAANCPAFSGRGARLHWPFDDPASLQGDDEEIMAGFRRVRDEIKARVESWLEGGL